MSGPFEILATYGASPAPGDEPEDTRPPSNRRTRLSVGDRVGEWTLLAYTPGRRQPPRALAKWLCRCSCGVEREVQATNLTSGMSRSCGHAIAQIKRSAAAPVGYRKGSKTLK